MCLIIAPVTWLYATGKYRLVDPDIDPHEVRWGTIGPMIALAVIAIAMGVSYLNPIASIGVFIMLCIFTVIGFIVQGRIRITEQIAK